MSNWLNFSQGGVACLPMKTEHTDNEFEELRTSFEASYQVLKQVHCPYLDMAVHFNAMGLEHLKFGRKNHARPHQEQAIRMQLFYLASQIIQASRTVQGLSQARGFEAIRSNGGTDTRLVQISYTEFVAILDNKRVRVVLKRIEDGPWFYWSVIPFWKINLRNGGRKIHYGNPEVD